MTKTRAIAIVLAAAVLTLPLVGDSKPTFSFTDPAGDVTGPEEGPKPLDIVQVDLSSDGEAVIVAVTLVEPPRPASLFQALVAGVAFDVDNDLKTGGHGFAGMHGPVPGIDFESEIISSLEDGAVSKSSAASLSTVDADGNQAFVHTSSDGISTPAKGKVYTGKVAYSAIGAKPGQTIRVIVRELDDRGETSGMFPQALLMLK